MDGKQQKKLVKLEIPEPRYRLLRGIADAEGRSMTSVMQRALMQYAVASAEGDPAVRDLLEQVG